MSGRTVIARPLHSRPQCARRRLVITAHLHPHPDTRIHVPLMPPSFTARCRSLCTFCALVPVFCPRRPGKRKNPLPLISSSISTGSSLVTAIIVSSCLHPTKKTKVRDSVSSFSPLSAHCQGVYFPQELAMSPPEAANQKRTSWRELMGAPAPTVMTRMS